MPSLRKTYKQRHTNYPCKTFFRTVIQQHQTLDSGTVCSVEIFLGVAGENYSIENGEERIWHRSQLNSWNPDSHWTGYIQQVT